MFNSLDPTHIELIHRQSIDILEHTGIIFNSTRAQRVFHAAGFRMEESGENIIVKIPEPAVEKALSTVPKSFTLYGRNGNAVTFARNRAPLFGCSGVPNLIADPETGDRRDATLIDFISIVKLLDSFDNVDLISPPCTFIDIPKQQLDLATFLYIVHTAGNKPFSMDFNTDEGFDVVLHIFPMLKERVYKGRDYFAIAFCPLISPLRTGKMAIDQMIETVKAGVPVIPATMAQAGISAPTTLAGTLSLMNAEILALVTLTQLVKPGAAYMWQTIPGITNFRTGEMITAAPEVTLLNSAGTQMAARYGIPNWATAGRSDSNILAAQAGYEQAHSIPWVMQSGATFISAIGGFLQSVCSVAYEKFVMDHELVGNLRRIQHGMEVNEETLARELIGKVGPGGNYLAEKHTFIHMRSEFLQADTMKPEYYRQWSEKGRPTAIKRAREKAEELIKAHLSSGLPKKIVTELKSSYPELRKFVGLD